ncbi:lasso RiPP family leader peptide-containing protein [Pengzhenrongella sicca]|uniref:Lasso RiPP family leader peptide-containing protein n=1 Tax=Pengzhenrongella sicca TaxID=2819238 RepID=A0A8A4ZBX2_9MICO|nr:lasso RiPP family leader peptide-containing protein [Pengzhenrongella sicca]QTE29422.1 lasso RiPP family leader peptide-containing protein [Pengzhenrongella sicca]
MQTTDHPSPHVPDYEPPRLDRLGTLAELTQGFGFDQSDGLDLQDPSGIPG